MPRISKDNIAQVRSTGYGGRLSADGATPDAFGAGIGRALMQTSDAMAQMQRETDEAEAKSAINALREKLRERNYGESGYYRSQGKNAYEGYEVARADLDGYRSEIVEGLKNDRQKQLFGELSDRLLQGEYDSMSRHAAKEHISWLNEEDVATIQGSISDTMLRHNDPKYLAISAQTVSDSVHNIADRAGWSPEKRKYELDKNVSALYTAVVNAKLEQDPIDAKRFFEENAGVFIGPDEVAIKRRLDDSVNSAIAGEAVGATFNPSLSLPDGVEAARAAAKEMGGDAKAQDAAAARYRQSYSDHKNAEAAANDRAYKESYNYLEANPGSSYDDIPAEHRELLTPSQKASLKKTAPTASDPAVWSRVNDLIGKDDEAFMKLDLLSLRDSLSPSDLKHFMKLQSLSPEDYALDTDIMRRVNSAADALSLSDKKKRKLSRAARVMFDQFSAEHSRRPTAKEMDDMVDMLLIEGEVKGRFIDPDKRLYEVYEDKDFGGFFVTDDSGNEVFLKARTIRDISPRQRNEIADMISESRRKSGQPPLKPEDIDEAVLGVYNSWTFVKSRMKAFK